MSVVIASHSTSEPTVWHCDPCGFTYGEAQGSAMEGFAPGTLWLDVPDNWGCPDCGQAKADFMPIVA